MSETVINPIHDHYAESATRRLRWRDLTYWPGNPISSNRLDSMRRKFGGYREPLIGVPLVVDNGAGTFPELPDDALVTADGNHRQRLAEEDGHFDDEIIVEIRRDLTRAQAAHVRRGRNDRRTIKPAETFLELVEEGDRDKAAIKRQIEGLGWRISHERVTGGLSCTKELEWIWKRDQGALILALATYEGAWGKRSPSGQAGVIKGLGAFWIKYPGADAARLVRLLKKLEVTALFQTGQNQYRDLSFIKSTWEGVRYAIFAEYNRNLTGKKKLAL